MENNIEYNPVVGIIMGSQSDWATMGEAANLLKQLDIPFETKIVSAHRTPKLLISYAEEAEDRGLQVIIAGAGGAAHLPGMVAANTPLPVIGVPVKSSNSLDGWDSLLSIAQMPKGVPVATVAVDAAANAGILATQILATTQLDLLDKIKAFKADLIDQVNGMIDEVEGADI